MDDVIWIAIIAVLFIVLVVLAYATWRGNKCCKLEGYYRTKTQDASVSAKQAKQKYKSQNRERNQLRYENDMLYEENRNLKSGILRYQLSEQDDELP